MVWFIDGDGDFCYHRHRPKGSFPEGGIPMKWAAIVWLLLLVVFLAAEAATVSMVSLWFAVSALVALLVALLGGPGWLRAGSAPQTEAPPRADGFCRFAGSDLPL